MDEGQTQSDNHAVDESTGAPPTATAAKPPEISEFLCGLVINQNPFYLISAALVLYGLSAGFGTNDVWINTSIPLTIMLTYAAVLSGIAVILIRRGRLWEDVRSILLALGILFFNVSAALDELLVRETQGAQLTVLAVWLLVPALVEFLRRGIGIRWPRTLTLSVHLILALLLIYPAISAQLMLGEYTTLTQWSIMAFPVLAGLALLTLLPSVRRLAAGNWDNGTPWRRLQLVVIIALPLTLLVRAYLLTTAFYPFPGMAVGGYHRLDTAFGGWGCVPIILAALVLLLEVGIVQQRALWRRIALFTAPAMIPLAMIGPSGSPAYSALQNELVANLGSPAMLAGIAVIIFAGIACLRRVPEAFASLFASILILSPVGGHTVDLTTLQPPSWLPMIMVATGCFATLLRYRNSVCFLSGWLALTAALFSLTGELSGLTQTALIVHFGLAGMIVAVLFFDDVLARATARALAALLPLLLLPGFWMHTDAPADPGPISRLLYAAAVIGICLLLQKRVHHDWYRWANYANLAHLGIFALYALGIFLDHLEVRGSGRIVAGAATLVLAVWISWLKTQRPQLD